MLENEILRLMGLLLNYNLIIKKNTGDTLELAKISVTTCLMD